jgi:hypothetical protein
MDCADEDFNHRLPVEQGALWPKTARELITAFFDLFLLRCVSRLRIDRRGKRASVLQENDAAQKKQQGPSHGPKNNLLRVQRQTRAA